MRILVIEDEPKIAGFLQRGLSDEGHRVDVVGDLAQARVAVGVADHDLILVDRMLPDGDGLALCRELRMHYPALSLIALGGAGPLDAAAQRVLGLELGADDVMAKPAPLHEPASSRELVARVRALLRRAQGDGAADWHCGPYRVDLVRRQLQRDGQPLALSGREFALLACLLRHRGQAVRRHELLREVWGQGFDGLTHTVDAHVHRLRAKLEPDPRRPRHLVTVRGVGYRLDHTD
ncbi:MAG: response regulator transcription factor [Rhodoferax sp.]|nr:response regulator transcription factor [Rhodoferax sp.]